MEGLKNIFNEKPEDRLWNRLEDRLERKKSVRKLRWYRLTAFAAMIAVLVFAVGYFNHILEEHNPHIFASNEEFSSFVLEEMEYGDEGLFNMAFFSEIRSAYTKSKEKSEGVDIAGNYKAKDGEISLSINMADFNYVLQFEYEGFPTLILEKIQGQTLYFTNDDNDRVKLNLEPDGLRLLESSFLPEYKNFHFVKLRSL